MSITRRHLLAAGCALIVTQVVHGIVPAPTSEHSVVGPVAGLLLVLSSVAAVIAIERESPRASSVLGWTGIAVAVGFALYHALPWKSPFTRPYVGERVSTFAWLSVAAAIAAGIWAATVAFTHAAARNAQ